MPETCRPSLLDPHVGAFRTALLLALFASTAAVAAEAPIRKPAVARSARLQLSVGSASERLSLDGPGGHRGLLLLPGQPSVVTLLLSNVGSETMAIPLEFDAAVELHLVGGWEPLTVAEDTESYVERLREELATRSCAGTASLSPSGPRAIGPMETDRRALTVTVAGAGRCQLFVYLRPTAIAGLTPAESRRGVLATPLPLLVDASPDPKLRYQMLTGQANSLRTVRDLEGALVVVTRAEKEFPDSPLVLVFKGTILFEAGKREDALVSFRRALALRLEQGRVEEHGDLALWLPGVIEAIVRGDHFLPHGDL